VIEKITPEDRGEFPDIGGVPTDVGGVGVPVRLLLPGENVVALDAVEIAEEILGLR
jgi:hypothetical protein